MMALLATIFAVSAPPVARADDRRILATSVIPVANAPLQITRCRYFSKPFAPWALMTNISNRTSHSVTSFSVQIRLYDTDGVEIGQTTVSQDLNDLLTPGDTATYNIGYANIDSSEPQQAYARVTCRLQSATFTGRKSWTYGQRWHEPLRRIETQGTSGDDSSSDSVPLQASRSHTVSASAGQRVTFSVVNAWNDTAGGELLVHDTLDIQGANSEATVGASAFKLTMVLANGAKKTYTGLPSAAPTYTKWNTLTNQSTLAHEVDPSEDLGALGAVTVPAHGSAHVTVTFLVPDPVANPSDNRSISQ